METQEKTQPSIKIRGNDTQRITPFLWFDYQAEEAVNFYTSIFKDSRINAVTYYDEASSKASGQPRDSVMTVDFQIEGQEFTALNGGPYFKFTPAISFFVNYDSPEKIDELWRNLSDGGKVLMELTKYPYSEKYGWIEDKYGVSWQLILTDETQKVISPCFLFVGDQNGKAEEAINFYTSLFKNSGIKRIERNAQGEAKGTVMYAEFTLDNQRFIAMDGGLGHSFTFTLAISHVINCETQEEIDYYWENLSKEGDESAQQCGWLTDKYGVAWQVVPIVLTKMLNDPDHEKSGKVMQAMLQMKKIDIQVLKQAYGL